VEQVEASIETIDQRILELLDLRDEYYKKAKSLATGGDGVREHTLAQELITRINQNELIRTNEHK
jgi:hypothetical protein